MYIILKFIKLYVMLNINCSRSSFVFPRDIRIIHHPYNGNSFSEYYTLIKENKSMTCSFGVGGFYPEVALKTITDYFK